jgi:hypothetical protein
MIEQSILRREPGPEILQSWLEKIDQTVLRGAFEAVVERLGVDKDKINFIDLLQFGNKTGNVFYYAEYSPQTNSIGIAMSALKSNILDKSVRPELRFLHVVIHEETHAVGRVECSSLLGQDVYRAGHTDDVIQRDENYKEYYGYYKVNRLYNDFNEGVTDLIALDVLKEYEKLMGHIDADGVNLLESEIRGGTHGRVINLVDGFIYRLSQVSGMSSEEILEMVKSSYFIGETLFYSQFTEYLKDILGEDYLNQLASGNIIKTGKLQTSPSEKWSRGARAVLLRFFRKIGGR